MPLNANHVYAPTPVQSVTTGACAVAPTDTARPTDAGSPLPSTWDTSGYIDENGISLTVTRSTSAIRDWSKTNVKNLLTEFTGSIACNFLQVDAFSAGRMFGPSNVSVVEATDQHGEVMQVAIGAELPPIESWCFSMKDGDARIRVYVPRGQMTDVGQIDYKPDAGNIIGGTLQCYDDGTGHCVYVIYDDGTVLAGSSDTALASLSIGDLTLVPDFYPGTMNYTAATTNASDAVSAVAQDSDATLALEANNASLNVGDAPTWDAGANIVTVEVSNGGSVRTYTVVVFKS